MSRVRTIPRARRRRPPLRAPTAVAVSIRAASQPSLSAALIRRRRPSQLAPPAASAPHTVVAAPAPATGWPDDLRFFLTCYGAGLLFFLIMLS